MPLPYRIDWQDTARADVRQIDRATALRILEVVLHYSRTGGGDVAPLHGVLAGTFRLRVGDYRVFFLLDNDVMRISAVLHRSQAYR
jgi:mRNA-degrading endonuclease RelE of RelBE toxin-antitoxin system